jgi:hypothetical protein
MAGPDPNAVAVGSLRWPIAIATRQQIPDPNSPGILDQIAKAHPTRADVQPVGPMTFYGAAQVDTPVTHRITLRWLDFVDTTCVIFRTTRRPNGTLKTELFRIRRLMDLDGRKRFLRAECELERIL